jgi:hypothetical protein
MIHDPEVVKEFIRLVVDLRTKQKTYFSTHSQFALVEAKAAERQVDGWLNHFAEDEECKAPDARQEPLL